MRGLAAAAGALMRSLDAAQLEAAFFCLESEQLGSWNFLPVWVAPRKGLELGKLDAAQRELVFAMVDAFLSAKGYQRADTIIHVLDEAMKEAWMGFGFGADLYRVSIFNDPSADGSWGARLEGHHLSLTFVVDGDAVSLTPAFFGAQPKEVAGHNLFGGEEMLAHAFVASLSTSQLDKALLDTTAPTEIVSGNATRIDATPLEGKGIAASELNSAQRDKLRALIAEAVSYQDEGFAAETMARVDASLAATRFAWMGPTSGPGRFYFRVYGPAILIEYDLTALIALGGAEDHPHLVIRAPEAGDFGAFAGLEEHLRTAPHHQTEREALARHAEAAPHDKDVSVLALRLRDILARHASRLPPPG